MQLTFKSLKFKNALIAVLIGVLVIVFTFPENDWIYSVGIDSSLKWLYNWMFYSGLGIGESIIFPHGPLAFLMYPLQENIILATAFLSFLKILLAINIANLLDVKGWVKWLMLLLIVYVLSVLGGIIQLILANVLLFYCNYFKDENRIYKILAFAIVAIAFYMRSYVAIVSGILSFSFLVYYFFRDKKFKSTLLDGFTIVGFILILWVVMYGTFSGFPNYISGMFHLAQDNSSAASYYPQNNWLMLIPFLVITIILPFLSRTKESLFYGILVTLSLFAGWKHAMAREDIFHVKGLLVYVVIIFLAYLIFEKKNRLRNGVLAVIAISLFSLNIKNAVNSYQLEFQFFGVGNFVSFISDFSEIGLEASEKINKNISINKLPADVRNLIGKSTVDIYPWDYSIISANNLNWQPRFVIQSYASYTHWLDEKDANHVNSKQAPEFIIWEIDKVTSDINGGNFESIDNRYLLNDEPQTIIEILRNYKRFYSNQKFLILKKRDESLETNRRSIKEEQVFWGKWISIPKSTSNLVRVKIHFEKSIIQRIKSFLYKDEQFWIYFKLKNDQIHKYRIVPKNAKDGLWVNPYIYDLDEIYEIEQVMFKCSNEKLLVQELSIEWEEIGFVEDSISTLSFLNNWELRNDTVALTSLNDFETDSAAHWQKVKPQELNNDSFLGKNSYLLNPDSYSATFTYPLDSLLYGEYRFILDGWIKSAAYKYSRNASLVLVVNDENEKVIWKGRIIDEQLLDRNRWNNISTMLNYKHQKPNCVLKAYLWNKSTSDFMIDDFRVIIQKEK